MPRSLRDRSCALREQTRILQSVLDCMGDGVVVADSNARFLVFNPAAAQDPGPREDRRRISGLVASLRDLSARTARPRIPPTIFRWSVRFAASR